jgi:hypothetical protein
LERARFHFESLHPEIVSFFDREPKPYRLVTDVDVETSRYLGRMQISRQPPLDWSVVIGDYVQNLRSALDHLAWQLVIANNETPNGNAFPLFDQCPPEDSSHPQRITWERCIKGIHPDAIRFIEFCQPYKALDGPGRHSLAGLRKLSNEDKHRTLIPVLAAVHGPSDLVSLDLFEVRDVRLTGQGVKFHAGRPLKDGDLVFQMPIEIIGPNPEIQAKGNIPVDVGFGRTPPVALKGIKQMSEAVEMVIRNSRRFIDG